MKLFFQKNWIHIACLLAISTVILVFFQPILDGYAVDQHDMEMAMAMYQEVVTHQEKTGESPLLWTDAQFSGMPMIFQTFNFYFLTASSQPFALVFLHALCFYVMAILLRIRPLIAVLGALAYSFASYEIILIHAGHITKSLAVAYMPLVLGLFVYAYRNRSWSAVAFSSLALALQIASNHVQITYYLAFVLVAVALYFFVKSIREKTFAWFLKISAGLVFAYALSALANSANLVMTYQYTKHTMRGGNELTIQPDGTKIATQASGLDKDYITNWSYGIGETVNLISPSVKGGGSFYVGGSQFESLLANSDFSREEQEALLRSPAYWGEQPFTSGPTYIGVVVALLALLGLVFLRSGIKWPLFVIALLAIGLSWGKNFMPLTDFFIDHFPLYAKFRSVTMILVLVELILVVIAVMFLEMLVREKEYIFSKKKLLFGTIGGFFVLLFVLKTTGLKDGYMSAAERNQMATIEQELLKDLHAYDPQLVRERIGLDVNDPNQVSQYVAQQVQSYTRSYDSVRKFREMIFHQSMNRSLIFVFLAGGLILLFVIANVSPMIVTVGMLLLVAVDMLPVANDYLGQQETPSGNYKYWKPKSLYDYPYKIREADLQIMESELKDDPQLKTKIDSVERLAMRQADELGYEGQGRQNMIERKKFTELNAQKHYRVFDRNGGFNDAQSAFFHKAFGGYHAAKLRSYQNLIEFHVANSNSKVFDMLNVKYTIHTNEQTTFAQQNYNAMGNAWMVKRVEVYDSPDDEIQALSMRFKLENIGSGTLTVNEQAVSEAFVFGRERIKYQLSSGDTINVPLSNGMAQGMEVVFVSDVNGKTDLVMPQLFENDTARISFDKLVKITADNDFLPQEEAVMCKQWAEKLSDTVFSGEGSVEMTHYQPNKIAYKVDAKGTQLVVFSEVFYPRDWRATIDGQPVQVLKANYLLRAVEVPSGQHTVELQFDIPEFHTYNKLSIAIYVLLFLGTSVLVYWSMKRGKPKIEA